ncbi:hypothetical protein LNI98_12225 [Tenacibaculum dicentrarchi]|uniref:Uncharacterized protein n=1 Tax=Tenacibaculum dicentrarchi TaxID=669041 RepID=A0ABP1EK49_9FLAO|nr:hypothetical protein [Tenacibaculum dicentrarchi]SOS52471.1 hypothetical protein TD3509T_390001 [Tenacibaculum dicentrarchi]
MNIVKKNRDFNKPIKWNGDLKNDCIAKWSGLILRAEWMDENYWWWCVYDILNKENQIDSSNEYDKRIICGEKAREKVEQIARNYLKEELINKLKKGEEEADIDKLIVDLKLIGISPMHSILTLIKDFGFNHKEAKNKVFNSPIWKGLREQSEMLTQAFLNVGVENSDEVEIVDGQVASITFDLTKDDTKKEKQTFWKRIKTKFK